MFSCSLLLGLTLGLPAAEPDNKRLNENTKEIAGTAEFLRSVPKRFGTLQSCDSAAHRVRLLLEGEKEARDWPVVADAEIKVAGWWGRLDQFRAGDRVWIWFKTDRAKQQVAVSMLADEMSEQDIHSHGVTLTGRDGDKLTLRSATGATWSVQASEAEVRRGKEKGSLADLRTGERHFVQTASGHARVILDGDAFEARRAGQKESLRKRWRDEGLPGTVSFLHIFSGEMDCILDHEALRWGRSLKPGDKVTLVDGTAGAPINAVVKHGRPWRERTQLRLVVNGIDQADLAIGQRVRLKMAAPAAGVDNALLPPDLDLPRTKEERLDWFLASIYCPCKVSGDVCTGDFYTLASCNPNGCGMPNHVRHLIGEKIDKGLNDRQILEELLKQYGPELLRPHLLP